MGLKEVKTLLMNKIDENNIIENVPMAEYTSFKAGGNADMMVLPQNIDELKYTLQTLADSEYPYMILGNGSNVLVKDGGYRGIMVKMGSAFDHVKVDGCRVECGAATLLSVAARTAAAAGLKGFEFA